MVTIINQLKTDQLKLSKKGTHNLVFFDTTSTTKQLQITLSNSDTQLNLFLFIFTKDKTASKIKLQTLLTAPNTKSQAFIYQLCQGQSSSQVDAIATITKDATNSETYLTSNSLLLSEKCSAKVTPSLEIENKQVKASHSSSIGNLDKEKLFYLTSRGLDQKSAKQILIESFLKENLHHINNDQKVLNKINKHLSSHA